MAHKTLRACKVCQSPYRGEIEDMRVKQNLPLRQVAKHLSDKYGVEISTSAIHNHLTKHYEYMSESMKIAAIASRKMFKVDLIDAGERAGKLSAVMFAAYEYVATHFHELDMKLALQMLFGSVDQLNKMQGTGAFAPQEFLLQFQGLLDSIKRGTTTQPTLIYEADADGNAAEITRELVDETRETVEKADLPE